VFRSSTYVFSSPESAERAFQITLGKAHARENEHVDLIYARLSHPNADILEDQIIPLEPSSKAAAVFNSGMAAISTLFLTLCRPGTAFIYTTPLYGGTHHLIHQALEPLGMHGIPIPAGNTSCLTQAIAHTKDLSLIFIETPANPTLRMSDIAAASEAAHTHRDRPLVAVDNTLMGPVFQHPLSVGADLVLYSATKYLSGFSDMLAGFIIGKDVDIIQQLRGTRAILGNILQPDECWLLDSRLPTVTFRMNRQSKNAQHIVEGLTGHPKIRKIYYPLLFTDPEQIHIRDRQCRFAGAMFSIETIGGKAGAFDFLRRLQIARNAVSLGGVETLACHPATTTHSEMAEEDLKEAGIGESLVRISIGVEDWRDLLHDFRHALDGVRA
jgi:cystathionine beta-lyase/cystathionine gamma-synthase